MNRIVLNACPVCRQLVGQSTRGNVEAHFDSRGRAGDPCPATGQPYRITIAQRRQRRLAA